MKEIEVNLLEDVPEHVLSMIKCEVDMAVQAAEGQVKHMIFPLAKIKKINVVGTTESMYIDCRTKDNFMICNFNMTCTCNGLVLAGEDDNEYTIANIYIQRMMKFLSLLAHRFKEDQK